MTAQIPESLRYGAETLALCDAPLAPFLALCQPPVNFQYSSSACWRRYVGAWEIVEQRLYLVGLRGTLENGDPISVGTLFAAYPQRVFAHWYSGTARCPSGKILQYKHQGYQSTYEKDIFLTFEEGVLVNERVVHNGTSDATNAKDGYVMAGYYGATP